nr:retrovirus-related Pol polyprotein from transposon TNT 1-94 [Tanacetum cinerariifolium]
MARDSRNQVERQEDKVAENARKKRKWEGENSGSSSQKQNKGHKVIGAHAVGPSNRKHSLPSCLPDVRPDSLSHEPRWSLPQFEEDQTLKDVEKAEKEIIPQHNDDPIDLDPYVLLTDGGEPEHYVEAMEDEHKKEWFKAMQDEMNSLHENNTFELVKLPKGKRALKNKWVYKLKTEDHNSRP